MRHEAGRSLTSNSTRKSNRSNCRSDSRFSLNSRRQQKLVGWLVTNALENRLEVTIERQQIVNPAVLETIRKSLTRIQESRELGPGRH